MLVKNGTKETAARSQVRGMRLIGHNDLNEKGDGMQIVVRGKGKDKVAFVSHMGDFEVAFSVAQVGDPESPTVLTQVPIPNATTHCHKVQVVGSILISNNEPRKSHADPRPVEGYLAGVRIFDVSKPRKPALISFFETGGNGVHRMWFTDGRHAHLSAGAPGFRENIYRLINLENPERPEEVTRWWLPGQAEEETPEWTGGLVWCHSAIPADDGRVFLSYWDMGAVQVETWNGSSPRAISLWNPSPPYGGAVHTYLPLPGRQLAIVTQESIKDRLEEGQKMVWVLDVRRPENPVPISTLPVPEDVDPFRGGRFGPHNVHENPPLSYQSEDLVFLTYFNGGLRVYDISNPYEPEEIASFVPPGPPRSPKGAAQINDVFVDESGLVYCTDRFAGGLYILELEARPLRRRDPRDLWTWKGEVQVPR